MDKNAKVLQNIIYPSSRMVFYILLDFVRIISEAQKLFFRNLKLMSSITLFIMFFSSILLVISNSKFSIIIPITVDSMSTIQQYPTTAEFTELIKSLKFDLRLFVRKEWIFIFASSFTSLFFATASILASAVTYCGKDLTIMELLSRAVQSSKRSIVTWFYITLLDLGYCLAFLLPLVQFFNSISTIFAFSIIIIILAVVFRSYLAVVWKLALVVSVLEENCGNEALGKAGQLIKGSKLRGFLLNLFGTFSIFVFHCLKIIGTIALPPNQVMISLLIANSICCLIEIFLLMTYTVVYYKCKEIHGEELEMQASMEYTKVTDNPLISADAEWRRIPVFLVYSFCFCCNRISTALSIYI